MTKHPFISISILLAILCFGNSDAYAQTKISATPIPAVKSDLAKERLLTNITKVGETLLAVGTRGHIILSTDGKNWQQANVPVSVLLTSISFVNEKIGFAVGHDATILKTQDGGFNWTLVNYQPELDRPLLSVHASENYIVAVGAYGMYWQSQDMGDTWSNEFHDELLLEDDRLFLADIKEFEPENYEKERQYLLPHFNDILITDTDWYLAGEMGFLAKSTNKGKDWQKISVDYFGSFFSVNQNTAGNLIVAGLRGNYFERTGNQQWTAFKMAGQATLNNSLVVNQDTYLFANSGNLYYKKDGSAFKHYVFDDGKAVMAGTFFKSNLVLATESGIKSLPLETLK